MESGCGDSDLCTDLYWVLTFCSMMSDLGVYLDGMIQGNAEGFKRGLNKVMEPFDGRLSYGEQAAYRLDVICYVVMTMNDHMDCSEEGWHRIMGRKRARSRKCRSKPLPSQKLTIRMKQMKIMMTSQMTRAAGEAIVQ